MNSSDPKVFCFIDNIQTSLKQNILLELKYKEEQDTLREGSVTNNLMAMLTVRVTAGVLTGAGQHNVASKEFLELHKTENETKEKARQQVKNNKYDRDIKTFNEGMAAMKKYDVHEKVMRDLNKMIDDETRGLMINTAKQKKKILLSRDYLALIEFKHII